MVYEPHRHFKTKAKGSRPPIRGWSRPGDGRALLLARAVNGLLSDAPPFDRVWERPGT
jgi:hypothetical protein